MGFLSALEYIHIDHLAERLDCFVRDRAITAFFIRFWQFNTVQSVLGV